MDVARERAAEIRLARTERRESSQAIAGRRYLRWCAIYKSGVHVSDLLFRDDARALALLSAHARTATAFQALTPGMRHWFAENGRGMVAYVEVGRRLDHRRRTDCIARGHDSCG